MLAYTINDNNTFIFVDLQGAAHAQPPASRMIMTLDGLSARRIAVEMWKRIEEHDAMTWAAAIAFYAIFATVPFLAIVLVAVVLRLPDLSGTGRRTTGLGNLTVDQLDTTLKSLFPNEAYVLVRDDCHIQGKPPLALISLGAGSRSGVPRTCFLSSSTR